MRIITIAMLALLTTSAQANQSNLDVLANIEAGCAFSLSDDRVNFNSADYTPTSDPFGGKYKEITLSINCSKNTWYKVTASDIDKNNNSFTFNLNNIDLSNNSKLNYQVTRNGNLLAKLPINQMSAGKVVNVPLQISVDRSPYNPSAGDYTGGFELVFTY